MFSVWHFVIRFTTVISLLNVALIAVVAALGFVERHVYHINYTFLRIHFNLAAIVFCAGTFLEFAPLWDTPTPRARQFSAARLICTCSAIHIECAVVPFAVERAFATLCSRNYETKRAFVLLAPIFIVLTTTVAWCVGVSIIYLDLALVKLLTVLITLNCVVYFSLLLLNFFNRRLSKILSHSLSQRYQIMENKRVLNKLNVIFSLDILIHTVALAASTCAQNRAPHDRDDGILCYLTLMNIFHSIMQLFVIRYSAQKHANLQFWSMKIVLEHEHAVGCVTVADLARVEEDSQTHFRMLNIMWK